MLDINLRTIEKSSVQVDSNKKNTYTSYPLTTPTVTSGPSPFPFSSQVTFAPNANIHFSHAHLVNLNTSSSPKSFLTLNSIATINDSALSRALFSGPPDGAANCHIWGGGKCNT